MPNYVKIYEGNTNGEGLFPFSAVKIPQYSNRPAYSKFKNFLLGNVEKSERRLTCNRAINALVANDNSLKINTDRCIACLACLCSCRNPFQLAYSEIIDVLDGILPTFEKFRESSYTNNLFNGDLKQIPQKEALSLKINSFDQYTAGNEVEHIALWVTIMLQFLASDNNAQIGKEIQIANPISPRDNRLDTCCLSYDRVLVGETKTSLDSLLQENRYRTQIPSYQDVIEKQIQEHNALYGQHKEAMILLIIGARETDLLPFGHPHCTSLVGDRSFRFYSDIIKYNIRFISAHLIWAMAVYSLITRKRLCWDLLFPHVFSDQNVLGILSGGQVITRDKQIALEDIPSRVLNLAVQDFS